MDERRRDRIWLWIGVAIFAYPVYLLSAAVFKALADPVFEFERWLAIAMLLAVVAMGWIIMLRPKGYDEKREKIETWVGRLSMLVVVIGVGYFMVRIGGPGYSRFDSAAYDDGRAEWEANRN